MRDGDRRGNVADTDREHAFRLVKNAELVLSVPTDKTKVKIKIKGSSMAVGIVFEVLYSIVQYLSYPALSVPSSVLPCPIMHYCATLILTRIVPC